MLIVGIIYLRLVSIENEVVLAVISDLTCLKRSCETVGISTLSPII